MMGGLAAVVYKLSEEVGNRSLPGTWWVGLGSTGIDDADKVFCKSQYTVEGPTYLPTQVFT